MTMKKEFGKYYRWSMESPSHISYMDHNYPNSLEKRTREFSEKINLEGLEGFDGLTTHVKLIHQGSYFVLDLSLTLPLKSCQIFLPPVLTLSLDVKKADKVETWLEIKKSLDSKSWKSCYLDWREPNNFVFFKLIENVTFKNLNNHFVSWLDLKLHIHDIPTTPRLNIQSKPTKELNDPTLQQLFTDSKIRDETSDFKIICEGEELKCHEFILSLRSDFFKTMFNGDMKEARQGYLNIEEFKLKTMKSFHKYLYSDSIDQCEVDVDLLRAAHMYDFKRLVGECEYGLSLNINEKNVKELFDVARTFELPTLFNQSKQKIQEMMNEWGQNETITRMNQIKQVFGSLKLGGSGNVSMDGFDEILKNKLNEYFESKE